MFDDHKDVIFVGAGITAGRSAVAALLRLAGL